MAASETGGEDLHPIAGIDRLIHEPARLRIMTYLYVARGADFLFLMRRTGLTAGNLSSHTSKLEAAGYTRGREGVCGPKAVYDAPADRCWERRFPEVSGGDGAGTYGGWLMINSNPISVEMIRK